MRQINKILMLGFGLFLTMHLVFADTFSDVISSHPNFTAINYLREKGAINGYPDNTFRPDQTVNRAEALKIILLGSNVLVPEIQSQEVFPDVLSSDWYGKYVLKAKNLNIIKGDDTTGFFRPGDTVKLAEALKILLKTSNKTVITPSSNPYADVPADAWFSSYFDYASKAGLLDQSSEENVNPATPVTRGMLAELMYRLITSKFIMADGKASYYGADFHGKTTASGEIFDASAMTAAHRKYPFGTLLKVTNVANGESIVVKVNDRGPYSNDTSRIIDLSQAAFQSIAALSNGIISVKIDETSAPSTATTEKTKPSLPPIPPVTTPSSTPPTVTDLAKGDILNATKLNCPDVSSLEYIAKTTFSNITLDEEIPTRFLSNELLILNGTTSSQSDIVTTFIVDENNNQTAFTGKVNNGRFSAYIRFPKEGTFQLGILPGESGKSVIKEVKALKTTCMEEIERSNLPLITGLDLTVVSGETNADWNPGNYNLFKLTFSQGGLHKSYILRNVHNLVPVVKEFESFKTADVELSIRGANLNKKSVIESAQIVWSPPAIKTFIAGEHYEYAVNDKEAELVSLTNNSIINTPIKAVFKPKVYVRSTAALILPTGKVKEVPVTSTTVTASKNAVGIDVFPSSGETLTVTYKTESTGVHILEINNAEGLAVINVPIYIRNQYPLIPNPRDLSEQVPVDLGNKYDNLRNQLLTLLNNDRGKYSLSPVKLDTGLNDLAQFRSDDMVKNDYFGHWDRQGRDANDLRSNYGIQTLVGENLAKDINLELAEYGLMRSAIHRSNILSPDWTRVGFGISKLSDGSYIFTQIFSEEPLNTEDINSLRTSVLNKINEKRSSVIVINQNLNTLAQSWSEKMVNEDFFNFTSKTGTALVDTIRNAGVNESLGTYLMGNSSFASSLDQISTNAELANSKWKKLGVGIKQDNLGIIKITLIYTE